MRKGYRDVLDPNDPYWPRVRRLHTYLWAKGTLGAKSIHVVGVLFGSLLFAVLAMVFSWAWRGALIFGALYLIDRIEAGMVSCVFRETVGYQFVLSVLSRCTVSDVPHLSIISLAALLLMILVLIYPIRKFAKDIGEIVFMIINIITLGYPLKFIAYLASQEPTLAGKFFDTNYIFVTLTTVMTDIFPPDYKRDFDHLWNVYTRSESPTHEKELEDLLRDFEAKYFP
jgi:hypothetical protein